MVDLKSNCKFRWRLYTEIDRNLSHEDVGDALVVPSLIRTIAVDRQIRL